MKNFKKGFTLIELLVVVAIIAILAVVVVVNYSGSRVKAENATVFSNLTEATNAANTCTSDKGTIALPVAGSKVCSGSTVVSATWPTLDASWAYGTNTAGSDWTVNAARVDDSGTTVSCSAAGCVHSW